MQIDKIQNGYNYSKTPSFQAGKVRVFSDFDKTFLPARHAEFQRNYDIGFVNYIRKYFSDFKDFLKRNKEGLMFTITTGRTFGEFATMAEISKERLFGMPLPDTLICKNGSDEYLRTGTDEDFYNNGKYPFSYDVTNKEKEAKIKELSGWDGPKIKEAMKKRFQEIDLRIVEADSEHGPGDYGNRSLFSDGKLRYEAGITRTGTDKSDWNVGFRNDGNCKIFVTYPYDTNQIKERHDAIFLRTAEADTNSKESSQKNLKVYISSGQYQNECGGRPYDIIVPIVDETMRFANYRDARGLTKVYDTKEAIKKAKETNDLVIVAGDSSNDGIMLDPTMYVLDKYCEKYMDMETGCFKKMGGPEMITEDPELIKELKELPYIGIVVKPKIGESKLEDLIKKFGPDSEFKKIIVVEEGHLQDGIKQAIKLYSEQNPEYKKKLSSDLKKEIGIEDDNITKPPSDNDDGDNHEKKSYVKYVIGGIIATLMGGIVAHSVKKHKRQVKHENPIDSTNSTNSTKQN